MTGNEWELNLLVWNTICGTVVVAVQTVVRCSFLSQGWSRWQWAETRCFLFQSKITGSWDALCPWSHWHGCIPQFEPATKMTMTSPNDPHLSWWFRSGAVECSTHSSSSMTLLNCQRVRPSSNGWCRNKQNYMIDNGISRYPKKLIKVSILLMIVVEGGQWSNMFTIDLPKISLSHDHFPKSWDIMRPRPELLNDTEPGIATKEGLLGSIYLG